jgi:2',3'-cyclic-nucleotide 2'-phosphodiesterase (5'-nucleotidase family)
VSDTVKEKWFLDALKSGPVDLILVAGHVQLNLTTWAGQEFRWILDAARKNPSTNTTFVVFFGGHSHVRDFREFDDRAYGLQSGRYGETVGFLSLSGLGKAGVADVNDNADELILANPTYQRRYIDANLYSYYYHARKTAATFDTQLGSDVSKNITIARAAL